MHRQKLPQKRRFFGRHFRAGAGYSMVYQVRDNELVVSVVAVGKRERNAAYKTAIKRI